MIKSLFVTLFCIHFTVLIAQSSPNDLKELEKILSKPGNCPSASTDQRIFNRQCLIKCVHDLMCPGTKKCCSNGCGFQCFHVEKPSLSCPHLTIISNKCLKLKDNCSNDNDCNYLQTGRICCQRICGKQCIRV